MKMQMGKLRQSWKGDAGWVLGRSRGGLDRGVLSVIGDSEGRLKTRPWSLGKRSRTTGYWLTDASLSKKNHESQQRMMW